MTSQEAAPGARAGPPQAQIDKTLAWITDSFRAYYRGTTLPSPSRLARREFGFLWNGQKFFLRHRGFRDADELHTFLAHEAPHHAYHSTAYFRTPNAPTMKEKDWLGADLIFDLDADHLDGADKLTFAQQLSEVHKQARKLLHEYLLGDFGFRPEHIRIVFSGGRGYHFHVRDPRVHQLDAAARREIVDYITPNNIVTQSLLEAWRREETIGTDPKTGKKLTRPRIPPASAPGWDGRITRSFVAYLEHLRALPEKEATSALQQLDGIGKKRAKALHEALVAEHASARLDRIREGYLGQKLADLAKPSVLAGILEAAMPLAVGETDEPVTADIKRLIRLPGSLHGKTGLRVTPLDVDEFDTFDPLLHAVAFGEEPVRVQVSKPIEIPLNGHRIAVEPGIQELPASAAVFSILRRQALLPLD